MCVFVIMLRYAIPNIIDIFVVIYQSESVIQPLLDYPEFARISPLKHQHVSQCVFVFSKSCEIADPNELKY